MKIAIVGAGFCGLAVAWHLLNHASYSQMKVELYDSKGIGQGTSRIAAGLLHPFAGAHAKLNSRGKEGFAATQELLALATQKMGRSVTASEKGILRLALTEEQKSDFQICAKKNPGDTEWLDPDLCQKLVPGCIYAPGLWIKCGLTVYSSLYLNGLWQACSEKGAVFKHRKIHNLKELANYDLTIVAAGAETLQLPELSALPMSFIKGQVLELTWPRNRSPLPMALNSHIYLLMTESKTSCFVGATFERGFQTTTIDLDRAISELLPKAIELYPPLKDASILDCYAGVRAVTPHHLPLIESISPTCWVITGMGSKGLLYHALFAKELVQMIIH